MAIVANTFQSTGSKTNREELSDVVDMITPEDTPIYSMIGKGTAKSTHPEWSIDELRAPGANVQVEGDEYIFNAIVAPKRVGNYTQIFRDSFVLSNTQEAVDDAGQALKVKHQKVKVGKAIRKDVEFSIVSNVGSVGGATRVSAGLPAWITTNASRGATGANGGFQVGTGLVTPATNGTQRAFTKTLLDNALQAAYSAGADVTDLVVAPYVKSVFVTFMSDANVAPFRYAASSGSKNTIVATADIYEGPYGKVAITMDRVMAASVATARNAFLIDRDKLEWLWLRKIAEDKDLAKTGDAQKRVIIGEGCLKVTNEAGLGVIADLFGTTPST
ncbi:DUF5309 domain-containing protein [Paracoccus aminovorans]|uniref:DUF5309 domain-containing protein n=1 Tax=Paracoccus aminovorans TaxID=34004 RepID=UPI00078478EB|nr:DUF5309 domain-containing protein [Paracoccus aminovorans]